LRLPIIRSVKWFWIEVFLLILWCGLVFWKEIERCRAEQKHFLVDCDELLTCWSWWQIQMEIVDGNCLSFGSINGTLSFLSTLCEVLELSSKFRSTMLLIRITCRLVQSKKKFHHFNNGKNICYLIVEFRILQPLSCVFPLLHQFRKDFDCLDSKHNVFLISASHSNANV
jgi:hypothetical protein